MAWFSKKPRIATVQQDDVEKPSRMQGLWAKCEECDEIIYRQEIEKNWNVCPSCGHHLPWPARARLTNLLDPGTFEEFDRELEPQDPLGFSDSKKYRDRLKSTRKALDENDAFISGVGRIEGHQVSVGAFVFEFMGGSMGSVVGEKMTRVFERAHDLRCAAILFSRLGRRPDAGGDLLADADGEDLGGDRALPRRRQAVHLGDAPPDHRRRRRLLRLARAT